MLGSTTHYLGSGAISNKIYIKQIIIVFVTTDKGTHLFVASVPSGR